MPRATLPLVVCMFVGIVATPCLATEYALDLIEGQLYARIVSELEAGRQIVDVEMQPILGGTDVRYSAVFAPVGGLVRYIFRADPVSWDNWVASMEALEGRFLDFEIETLNGQVVRSGLFWEGGGEDYRYALYSESTEADFQSDLETFQDLGMAIIDFESFVDPGGNVRFGGLWVDGAAQPRTHLYYGLTWDEVNDLLDPLPGRIVDLERYGDEQGRLRWGIILAMYPGGESLAAQAFDAIALAALDDARGDNLIDIDSYESAPGILGYNAVWGDDWKSFREVDPYAPHQIEPAGSEIDGILAAFEAGGQGDVGLFARNVRLGEAIGYRSEEPFYLASSAKLAIHLRLWQLHQIGHLDIYNDTIRYSDDPLTAIPWFVDERPDCGGGVECGLSTGACNDGDDRNLPFALEILDRGMMRVSDNAATSMIVDDPSLGLAFDEIDLNEWLSALPGVGRGFGLLTSIQDLDRVIAWQGQYPNSANQPSYFGAPRAGLETATRGGSLAYQECQRDNPPTPDDLWTGIPCGCGGQTGCSSGQTCTPRSDPWGDLTAYLLAVDPAWSEGSFPGVNLTTGHARYYNVGINSATPLAFGTLQERFVAGQLLDGPTTESALAAMITGSSPLVTGGIPSHIESFSKGGSKGGTSDPCSDTTIFRVGPDAVVLNVLTKNNQRPCSCPTGSPGCGSVRAFWPNPPTASGTALGVAVLQRLLPDLRTADPEVVSFAPVRARPGQDFDALVDVTNAGGVASLAFDVTFYAVSDGVVGDGDDIPIGTVRVPGLAAGETTRVRLHGPFPADIPVDEYEFGWFIDPDTGSLPYGEVGELNEGSEQRGVADGARLTVLPPPPPCVDLDLDGFVECHPDCDPSGLSCGDCDDGNEFVSPSAADTCNGRDDDCDGVPDPGAAMAVGTRWVVDPDPDNDDELGTAIAAVGDLDGDGTEEYAIGQPNADSPSKADAGVVRVHSGATGDLLCIAYESGADSGDDFGASVSGLADVNGDGTPDFVVGAPFYDENSVSNTGAVWIFDGATCTHLGRLGSPLTVAGDQLGTAVAAAGDVDLDGVPDFAVGAPGRDGPGSDRGAVVLYSGRTRDRIRELTDPASPDNDRIGTSIASLGDVDDDLVPDIAVGAIHRNADRGAVIIFSGLTGGVIDTWTLPGAAGGDKFGSSLAALGDVTGDGTPDLVVGAIDGDTLAGTNTGEAYILSGADGSVVHTLSDLSGSSGDEFGFAVSGAGDLDGDGLEDVAVGARLHDTAAGLEAGGVVIFSSATGAPLYNLEDPKGRAGERLGSAVARLGDLTGDGRPELAAGSPRADETDASRAGRVVVWSIGADCDLDGATPFGGDCDDQDDRAAPAAPEICDAIDNDCDSLVDEDGDGDSYSVCDECDDGNAQIFPGAPELCNGLDDDCDDEIDEGVDADLDGFTSTCDCDDGNDAVNPGASDTACDRIDQDCNGVTDDGANRPASERPLDLGADASEGDNLGASVAVVGDLNGDGLAEIAAGVPSDDTVQGGAGAVAIFDGATGGLHCLLTDPDGAGFDELGRSVAASADLDGDGTPEIVAGAPGDDDPALGAGSVVVFSGAGCSVAYKTRDPAGDGGARLGEVVASIGDQNGDGRPEFAASAPAGDDLGLTNAGRVVVFDGATGAVRYRVNNVNPRPNEEFGQSIAGGRDLDADGIPDFVVGTPRDSTRVATGSGTVVVYSGATGAPIRKLLDDDGGLSDALGTSVALIDDLDGDAVADILSGAPEEDSGGSNAGVILAFSGATGERIGRASFDQPGTQERLGRSIAALPDIDGDGTADIAAGAPEDDEAGTDTGSVYLISGADFSLIRRLYRAAGQPGAELGTSVAVAPDLSGDGMPEIVAGAPFHDLGAGTAAGHAVIFALEGDCDGDGVSPFGGDCDDGNGDAYGRPGDVESFTFSDRENASWQPPSDPGGTVTGLSYDVIRSGEPADFTAAGTCIESDGTDTVAFLPGIPPPGSGYFFLARARNACGTGPAGFDSTRRQRDARDCP